MKQPKRPYRLVIDGYPYLTRTYTTAPLAQDAGVNINGYYQVPKGTRWRVELREGAKRTTVCEGLT